MRDDWLKSGKQIGAGGRRLNPLEKKALAKKKAQALSLKVVGELCAKGHDLDDIAQTLGVSPLAVARVIEKLIRKGELCEIDQLIPSEIRSTIEETFYALGTSSVKKVAMHLGGRATVEQIRIVRAVLQADT